MIRKLIRATKKYRDFQNNILFQKRIYNFDNIQEKQFVDIPATEPKIKIYLPKVGVTQRVHHFKIKDIFDESITREFQANLKIFLDLPSNQRGLHMSRIEKAMLSFLNSNSSLREYAENLLKYTAQLQNRDKAILEIDFLYEKQTMKNSSQRLATEILQIFLKSVLDKDKIQHSIGMSVPFMNACPCPQRWNIRYFYNYLKERFNLEDENIYELLGNFLPGTHTNLGNAKLIIDDLNNNLNYQDIYEVLDSSVNIARELLSGQDEFEFIRKSLIEEQFCEDSAREIINNLIFKLSSKIHPEAYVDLEVEVDESIHFHNLKVEVKEKFKNLNKINNNENI